MAKLLYLVKELKNEGKSLEEIAKELGKPLFLIRALMEVCDLVV